MEFPGGEHYPKYSQDPFLPNGILDGIFNDLVSGVVHTGVEVHRNDLEVGGLVE